MIRALLLVFLGTASFAAVYVAMAPDEPDIATPQITERAAASNLLGAVPTDAASAIAESDGMAFELRPGTEAPSSSTSPKATREVRNVTPADMTAGPLVTGALTRVERPAPEPLPSEARMQRLFSPIVISAGAIKAGDKEIRLAGITAPDADTQCGEGEAVWPCGRVARSALRRFIRGRAIECQIPAGADAIPDPASCFVAGEAISGWLVAQGWAEPTSDAFEDAAKQAREAKLGLFSGGWPGSQPEEVAASR